MVISSQKLVWIGHAIGERHADFIREENGCGLVVMLVKVVWIDQRSKINRNIKLMASLQ